jgi:hypothetical protein
MPGNRRSPPVEDVVEDVKVDADGLRLRILRGKTDQEGQGAEIGLPGGKCVETVSAARLGVPESAE